MANCYICKRALDLPGKPETLNCGGDCMQCMAEAGDRDCIEAMVTIFGAGRESWPKRDPYQVDPLGTKLEELREEARYGGCF